MGTDDFIGTGHPYRFQQEKINFLSVDRNPYVRTINYFKGRAGFRNIRSGHCSNHRSDEGDVPKQGCEGWKQR